VTWQQRSRGEVTSGWSDRPECTGPRKITCTISLRERFVNNVSWAFGQVKPGRSTGPNVRLVPVSPVGIVWSLTSPIRRGVNARLHYSSTLRTRES